MIIGLSPQDGDFVPAPTPGADNQCPSFFAADDEVGAGEASGEVPTRPQPKLLVENTSPSDNQKLA